MAPHQTDRRGGAVVQSIRPRRHPWIEVPVAVGERAGRATVQGRSHGAAPAGEWLSARVAPDILSGWSSSVTTRGPRAAARTATTGSGTGPSPSRLAWPAARATTPSACASCGAAPSPGASVPPAPPPRRRPSSATAPGCGPCAARCGDGSRRSSPPTPARSTSSVSSPRRCAGAEGRAAAETAQRSRTPPSRWWRWDAASTRRPPAGSTGARTPAAGSTPSRARCASRSAARVPTPRAGQPARPPSRRREGKGPQRRPDERAAARPRRAPGRGPPGWPGAGLRSRVRCWSSRRRSWSERPGQERAG